MGQLEYFIYFCLSFDFFIMISVNMTLFGQFLLLICDQKITHQLLFFHFVRFCAVALFILQEMLLIVVLLLNIFVLLLDKFD